MIDGLEERFRRSLDRFLELLRADPQVSIAQLFGSVQRKQHTHQSDIDVYIITDRQEFWRASEVVEGVVVEKIICPLHVLHWRLTNAHAVTLQAFTTGETLLDRDGKAGALVALARERYQQGPPPLKPAQLDVERASLTRIIQKLEQLPEKSPEARFLAGDAIQRAVTFFYESQRLWIRGLQHCVGDIRERDPRVAELLLRCLEGGHPAQTITFIEAVIAPLGGHLQVYEAERTPC